MASKKHEVDCKTDRQNIHKLLKLNTDEHTAIVSTLTEIHSTLNKMNTIRINGSEEPLTLEDALREVYKATKEARARRKLKESFLEWKSTSAWGGVISTKIGKLMLTFIGAFTIMSILFVLGVVPAHPVQLITKFILFVKDLL